VIDPNMDGEMQITVVATGFGQTEPRLRLVDKTRAAPGPNADDAELRHPQWQREEPRPNRWGRGPARSDSLEVPAFLRKQMD
jgi:cell division GTPase FtsZ